MANRHFILEPDHRITSSRNPRVRAVVALRKRRGREAYGRFVGEGPWVLRMALDAGVVPIEVFFNCDYLSVRDLPLLEQARRFGARLVQVSEAALRRMSYRDDPEGVLAIFSAWSTDLDRLSVGQDPLILVVETIEKPGNLGSMVRTACAAGADAVIVCDPQTDPFGPGVVRASLGTLFAVPVAVETGSVALSWLRSHGLSVIAATPQGRSQLWEADLVGSVAIAIGNEHRGLSSLWMSAADQSVRIPMIGPINSLNATMAGGILLYEALRQRQPRPGRGRPGG